MKTVKVYAIGTPVEVGPHYGIVIGVNLGAKNYLQYEISIWKDGEYHRSLFEECEVTPIGKDRTTIGFIQTC